MTTTVPAGASAPAAGRPDAPTARLLLPADAPRSEWLEVRRVTGIGGSDVSAIFGLDTYRGPWHVYEDKHGRAPDRDSEPMKWGRRLEGVIAEAFSEETGLAIADPPGMLQHLTRPWMLSNVDRYVLNQQGCVIAPLECKNKSEYQDADWTDGVPDSPALQVHWNMATGGWDHGWAVALVGGNKLRWHRLDRDEGMIEHLIDVCGRWWQRHVLEGAPPPPDGSNATTELLKHLWSVKAEDTIEVDVLKAKELRGKRAELKDRAKELDRELNAVENEMRVIVGRAEIAQAGAATAWTYKANGTFRSKAFRNEEPDLYRAYTHMVPALDTDRLAEEKPEVYQQYRARTLLLPKKGW